MAYYSGYLRYKRDDKKLTIKLTYQLSEEQRRLLLRNELTLHNKTLTAVAQNAGVSTSLDAIFQDHGYRGLYGGLSVKEIHGRKKLKKSQKILDHMGSTELAAN